jgi:hypothetical protein
MSRFTFMKLSANLRIDISLAAEQNASLLMTRAHVDHTVFFVHHRHWLFCWLKDISKGYRLIGLKPLEAGHCPWTFRGYV